MLVANPGQTPYLHSQTNNCHGFSMAKPTQTIFQARFSRTAVEPELQSTTKTLSIRLNRGNEFNKDAEQKAQILKLPSNFSKILCLNTVPPTDTHRFPERNGTNSTDSLNKEMCHFKPIRTAPNTLNKKSKTSYIKTPVTIISKFKDCEDEINWPKLSSELSLLVHSENSAFCPVGDFVFCRQSEKISQSYKTEAAKIKSNLITSQEKLWNNAQIKCNKKLFKKPGVKSKRINNLNEKNIKIEKETLIQVPIRRSLRVRKNSEVIPKKETKIKRTTRKRQNINASVEDIPLKRSIHLTKGSNETSKKPTKTQKTKQPARFSPPLTRSRLKNSVVLKGIGAKRNHNQNY